ncbi:MAG: hypothetical protein U0X91_05265 [Spirosomataceae bacterium]
MLFSEKTRSDLFRLFAVLAALAALYHGVGIFDRLDEAPPWRHFLFMGISAFCVYGSLKRPPYFVYVVALLLVQQYYSHGSYLLRLWAEHRQIHWISVGVLLLMPIFLLCLWEDRTGRHRREKR